MANQFLIKNTMADMRALSAAEVTALTNGTYSGVQLLGYYQAGDTPTPIIYYYFESDTTPENDGDVIAINGGRLIHKFRDAMLDVRYFGAKGDGIQDDTAYIQEAINTGNKIIFIPSPLVFYKVTTLRVNKSQIIQGDGMFNKNVVATDAVIQGDGINPTIVVGESTGKLRYVKIIDISINNDAGTTVKIDYSPNWELVRCTITNRTGIAIDVRYSWRGSIEKCFISGGNTAIRAMDNVNGFIIEGNTITGGRGGRAVSIGQSQGVSICRNIIEASLHGIWIASTIEESNSGTCNGVEIRNNYIEQCSSPIVVGTRFTVLACSIVGNFISNGQNHVIADRTCMIALGRVDGCTVENNSFLMDVRANTEDLFHFHLINNERNTRNTTIRNNSFGSPYKPANYYKLVGEYSTNGSYIRLLGGDNNNFDFLDRFDGLNSSEIREWISPVFRAKESVSITKWITHAQMRFGGRLFSIEIVDKQGGVNGCKISIGISSNINSVVNSVDIGTLVYTNGVSSSLITAGNNASIYATEPNFYRITASELETETGTFRVKIRYKVN